MRIKEPPKVSVIIPTFNRSDLLKRSVKSVLNQTFQEFELIIVDDASADDTTNIVREIEDSRINYIKNEKNLGKPLTLNRGIRLAKGEYVGLLDDDDEWLPEKLEKQIKKFDNTSRNVGVVYCGFSYVLKIENNKNISKILIPELNGHLYTDLLKSNFIGGSTPLIKKECFQKSGYFDRLLQSGQDWDMWIRISKNYEFDFVREALVTYHIHGEQISVNFNDRIKSFQKILDKYIADISKYPTIYNLHLLRIGIFLCLNKNVIMGRKFFFKAVKVKPVQMNAYLNLILSKFPRIYLIILNFVIKHFTLTGYFLNLNSNKKN